MSLVALMALFAAGIGAGANAAKPALYLPKQASAGAKLYDANCASCHGERLEGGVGPALSGRAFRTLAKDTKLTVGDVFSWVSVQMPLNQPASLKKEQYVEIMAYLLKFNGYPAGSKPLSYDAANRSDLKMSPR